LEVFDGLKEKMNNAGMTRFGSGWAWLIKDASGNLAVVSFTQPG
jgi:Fe-Mn family superoxide dismutase